MYETILVPSDGSDCADVAVEEAIGLATRFDATLHTVFVVDSTSFPGGIDLGYVFESLEEVGETVTSEVVEWAREEGVTAKSAVLSGTPHRAILDYARDNDVDLIVMGTHGRQGLERYLLGSVTEKIVRTADVPVLTVRQGEDDAGNVTGGAGE